MEDMKTLKLDSSFRPIGVIDSIDALVMCLVGKAKSIETHNREINSVSKSFKLPAVIVLNRYVKFIFETVVCNRVNVLWRYKNQCQYCGKVFSAEHLTLDHIIPKSKGGLNSWTNMVAACKKCNQRKGNKSLEQSGMRTLRKPYRPKANILRMLKKEQISPKWKNYLWDFS